jgi:dihydroorotase
MVTSRYLIKGGRVIDPETGVNSVMDIVVKDGKIISIGKRKAQRTKAKAEVIDASGKIVTPGLIDMHVHLREPGHEYKETIDTGAACRIQTRSMTISQSQTT